MFNRLKNQLNEKSGSDIVPSVDNTKKLNRKSPSKTIELIKSNHSDGNQSSDDSSSLKSQKNNFDTNQSSLTHNNHEKIDEINNLKISDQKTDPENANSVDKEKDTSIKSQLQDLNQSLLKEIDKLHIEINQKNHENEELRSEFSKLKRQLRESENNQERLKIELDNYESIIIDYESELKSLKTEKEELIIKNAELSGKYEMLKLVNNKQLTPSNSTSISIETDNQKSKANETENQRYEYQEENKTLRDEINEKNKTIKNLQQRLNDMKKTLQKELKYQMLPNEKVIPSTESIQELSVSQTNSPVSPVTSNTSILNHQSSPLSRKVSIQSPSSNLKKNLSATDMSVLHEDVNFKYLKHVVLKFLTSREYEAVHLVKALSVLLNLSKDEEKIVKETLEWKMSWFGSKPKLI